MQIIRYLRCRALLMSKLEGLVKCPHTIKTPSLEQMNRLVILERIVHYVKRGKRP